MEQHTHPLERTAVNTRLINTIIFLLPVVLILPLVFQYGVFFDGALYGAYARNLAEGIGSFWNTVSWPGATSPVRDQPPLAFFLESYFFRALGNRFFVEGLYGIVCLYLTLAAINRLQHTLPQGEETVKKQQLVAWPVALYLTLPIVLWASRNNMIENTLTVFTTWATYFGVAYSFEKSRGRAGLFANAFTLLLVAAYFTKGPVALFPLATPFVASFVLQNHRWRKHFLSTFFVASIPALATVVVFALLWLVPEVRSFTYAYFLEQILPSSLGQRESSGSHFTIVRALFNNATVPIAIALVLAFFAKTISWRFEISPKTKASLVWFLVFLSAWVPFLISTKQMSWYLIPSFPFLCLAIVELTPHTFHKASNWLAPRRVALVSTLALVVISGAVASAVKFGNVYKNESFYNSFLPLENTLPTRTQYGVCNENLLRNWRMVTPLLRYFQSAVVQGPSTSGVWIIENAEKPCFNTNNCRLLNSPELEFKVYSCLGEKP